MNPLMFVPVGVLMGAAFRRMNWKKVLVIGAGLSIGIEGCAIRYGVWLMIC